MVKSESKKRRRIVEERQKGYVSDLDLGDGDYMNGIHHQSVRFIILLSPAIKVPVSLLFSIWFHMSSRCLPP